VRLPKDQRHDFLRGSEHLLAQLGHARRVLAHLGRLLACEQCLVVVLPLAAELRHACRDLRGGERRTLDLAEHGREVRASQMQLHVRRRIVQLPRAIEVELCHALRQHALSPGKVDQVIERCGGDALVGECGAMRRSLQRFVRVVELIGARRARRGGQQVMALRPRRLEIDERTLHARGGLERLQRRELRLELADRVVQDAPGVLGRDALSQHQIRLHHALRKHALATGDVHRGGAVQPDRRFGSGCSPGGRRQCRYGQRGRQSGVQKQSVHSITDGVRRMREPRDGDRPDPGNDEQANPPRASFPEGDQMSGDTGFRGELRETPDSVRCRELRDNNHPPLKPALPPLYATLNRQDAGESARRRWRNVRDPVQW
jgi:hypothetical protein